MESDKLQASFSTAPRGKRFFQIPLWCPRLPFDDLLWPLEDLEAEKKISKTVYYNCVEGT